MARTVTRDALRDDIRALCDAEGDNNVADAQIYVWINGDIQRLWNKLVAVDPDRCTQTTTVSATAGTLSYPLPADFFQLRAVDLVQGADRIPIHQWVQQERWAHRNASSSAFSTLYGQSPVHYRLMGQGIDGTELRIHFLPDPGTNTYELRYIEIAPTLTAGSGAGGVLDGIAGFEQWIAYRCARRIMKKQQRYEGEFEGDIAELDAEIAALAPLRDAAEAPRIARVRSPRFLVPSAR